MQVRQPLTEDQIVDNRLSSSHPNFQVTRQMRNGLTVDDPIWGPRGLTTWGFVPLGASGLVPRSRLTLDQSPGS